VVGIRPGEKLHEEMVTETDAISSLEFDDYFVILPSMRLWDVEVFTRTFNGKPCSEGFSYNSGTNNRWLTVGELRDLIRSHVDPAFTV
jgi:FlaA1/EpsC-like NDP-sugar epimerase